MKTVQEIFKSGLDPEEIIQELSSQTKDCPEWSTLSKDFDFEQHDIVKDPSLRPDEKVTAEGKRDRPAKITYPAEYVTTRRMKQMAFSIPVKRLYSKAANDTEKAFQKAIEKVYEGAHINHRNPERMFAYFGGCEVATFWYAVHEAEKSNRYGFESDIKFRCRSFSPMPKKFSRIPQATIYPYFDDYDDLLVISVKYTDRGGNTHFDAYTADTAYHFVKGKDENDWTFEEQPNPSGKIPAAYLSRPLPIYYGIPTNRDDIEFTLSRNSDNIRKNSSPIIKVSGQIIGTTPTVDPATKVYQVENGGDVDLIAPALTTTDADKHVKMLKANNEEITQLPDLSLENVRGAGIQSGESRKTVLMDAQLKVGDEANEIEEFFTREFNVIKAMLCVANPEWKDYQHTTTCTHKITAFVQDDESTSIKNNSQASGVLISQHTAIERAGLADDPDAEYQQILKEKKELADIDRSVDLFEAAE